MAATAQQQFNAFEAHIPPLRSVALARPIDMKHLSVQTMGDRQLEQEVLGLFVKQVLATGPLVAGANADDRRRIAHTLKGSARSVGAFALGDCLEQVEQGDQSAIKALPSLIEQVCNFVASIGR